ncbi:MAG TPA: nucleoside deaminase [Bacteroidales bacterium]|nr:nucleoside deaminase [Bacteroidales bacterium]
MKKTLAFVWVIICICQAYGQEIPGDNSYFVTNTREEVIRKLVDLPLGIKENDPINVMFQKIKLYLDNFQPTDEYSDDIYAKAANQQALISVIEGGYGIGSVLLNKEGDIIAAAHNSQIQDHRSDLHAEMTLLTKFEESRRSKKYMNLYVYKPGLVVFSSAEPCPMCFIRINTTGCDTKYCTPGPDDGMVSRTEYLPPAWKEMALQRKVTIGDCSPIMQKIAHLLFYSYLLDNRGPH